MKVFLLAAFVGVVVAHGTSQRKSLSFGPSVPHSTFETPTVPAISSFAAVSADPFVVARNFINQRLSGYLPADSFNIREDSYTDSNTGITHIYAQQQINGLPVDNGLFNLNIKNGKVLSFGDSFHRGSADFRSAALVDPHAELCAQLNLDLKDSVGDSVALFHKWNCEHVAAPYALSAQLSASDSADPQAALLQFMIAATPNAQLSQQLFVDPMAALSQMVVVPQLTEGETLIENVPGAVGPVKAKIALVQVPVDGQTQLEMVWKFEVEMADNWYEAAVTVEAPHRIISVVDWASDAPMHYFDVSERKPGTYRVFKFGINDPTEGERTLETELGDTLASPIGWHSLPFSVDPSGAEGNGIRNTSTTFGNNVFAQENFNGKMEYLQNGRPDAGDSLRFNYSYAPKPRSSKPQNLEEARKYINASTAQLFYTVNTVHDLYYRYGFDEPAGNFQQHNFGRGGKERDAVIANAQDGSGYNNANFMTPPDGQNGKMRMYLWNEANPYRDGDFEAGVVIHEFSHGLSTRLTGGPANSGCLGWAESGGMGEGWGDFLATIIRSKKIYKDYPMGEWVNNGKGIRPYPYSVDKTVNPVLYNILDRSEYGGVHPIGSVWAEMLYVVAQKLIQKHGFSETLFPPKPNRDGSIPDADFYRPQQFDEISGQPKPRIPKHGNTLIVQLVINGMKLQPCRPSFFDAREAIIAADKALTGGENRCDIYSAFAERGLGIDATLKGARPWGGGKRTNGFKVPADC